MLIIIILKSKYLLYSKCLLGLVILSTCSYSVSGQQKSHPDSLKFTLYAHDKCTNKYIRSLLYYFKEEGGDEKYKPKSETGECLLPHKGKYQLYFVDIPYPLTYEFKGQVADTLNFPALFFGFSLSEPPKWVFCNKIAHGKLIDYFKPGKKRLQGKFKNGKLIGKLFYYDLDSKLVKVENKHNFTKH
ncbi:MAG TPA: hypothetical protein VK668_06530 [Mucilaginibacter sp.]|nr:hypothetical protein [Mucilaginibacter sp.]